MPLYSFICNECGHQYQSLMSSSDTTIDGCNQCGDKDNQKKQISKPQTPKMDGYKEWGYNKYTQETTFSGNGTQAYKEYDHRETEAKTKELKKKIEGFGTGVAINKKSKNKKS